MSPLTCSLKPSKQMPTNTSARIPLRSDRCCSVSTGQVQVDLDTRKATHHHLVHHCRSANNSNPCSPCNCLAEQSQQQGLGRLLLSCLLSLVQPSRTPERIHLERKIEGLFITYKSRIFSSYLSKRPFIEDPLPVTL